MQMLIKFLKSSLNTAISIHNIDILCLKLRSHTVQSSRLYNMPISHSFSFSTWMTAEMTSYIDTSPDRIGLRAWGANQARRGGLLWHSYITLPEALGSLANQLGAGDGCFLCSHEWSSKFGITSILKQHRIMKNVHPFNPLKCDD